MPSPFPGMDPYLEGSLWTTLHGQLAAEIARQLAPQIVPKYIALNTERFVVDDPDDVSVTTSDVYPDVHVLPGAGEMPGSAEFTLTAPVELVTVMPTRVPHFGVEIRDTRNRELVTAIEILSPTNKRGRGRREYLSKRRRVLLRGEHLMEIDLLRRGRRVPMLGQLPDAELLVFLSRVQRLPRTEIWPIRIRDRLPRVPVPLWPPDPDVVLDLQRALDTIYDALGYYAAIDYDEPPDVPLAEADSAWAFQCIKSFREKKT